MIAWLLSNIAEAVGLIATLATGLLALRWTWRQAGVRKAEAKTEARRRELQEAFNEIDTKAPDPSGAYDSLRGMSGDRR
jgi:uncharacterized membrane-anchored protein YhcB (DUF1043 family)